MRVHLLSAAPGWLLLSLLAVGLSLPLQAKPGLSVAWSHWPPFSYINPQGTLDGLDVTLTRQILSKAGLEPHFRNLPWARAIHLLELQQLDVAMGALDTPERRAFARFSVPYRRSTFVLLSNNPIPGQHDPWLAVSDLPQLCQQSQLRLGKLRGTRPIQLMEACPALKNASEYNADDRLVDLLLARRLDGVIMEWQYARYRLHQLGADGFIRCQLLLHHQPVSLMFANSAVTDAQLTRVNEVIAGLPSPGRDVALPPCRLDNPAAEQVTPNQ
ncbi:substrate-binding periplasmic protein [Aeromonas hydrophila]|uniref:substrate-binding periplasmic protein n=1 Tax=Aeromonas hydrophila TaxID=644 RepID=UPI0030170FBE